MPSFYVEVEIQSYYVEVEVDETNSTEHHTF